MRLMILLCALGAVIVGTGFAVAERDAPTPAGRTVRPVAVRFWGQGMVSIETYWNLRIAIDPYAPRIGYDDPGVKADLVLVTHEHGDHNNVGLVGGTPRVERGLDKAGAVRAIDLLLGRPPNTPGPKGLPAGEGTAHAEHAVRVRSVASHHDGQGGRKRGQNAMFLIEADGVRILHCGDLGQPTLSDEQRVQIGQVDLLLIPVGGVYTVDGPQAAAITEQVKPRIVVPIHYKTPALKIGLKTAEPFLDALPGKYKRTKAVGNTLAVSRGRGPTREKPAVVVLGTRPWRMPAELAALFERKEKAGRAAAATYAQLSVAQLNHRPSDGSHTPRWNAEHIMGRDLGFFTAIYTNVDPAVPHLNLNPAQMPKDYLFAHTDWTGEEEARQIERVLRFTRRFAYLLDGMDLDRKPKGSSWTPRGLLKQMEWHYSHHTANVKKKFALPDWPAK